MKSRRIRIDVPGWVPALWRLRLVEALARVLRAETIHFIPVAGVDYAAAPARTVLRVEFALGERNGSKPLPILAKDVFGLFSAMLPARVVNEELGDALEDVADRIAEGRPRHEILTKIYSSVFWALWHTVLYAVKGVTDALGRKGG